MKRLSELLVKKGLPVAVYSMDLSPKVVKEQDINGVLVKRFEPLVGDPLYFPPPSFFSAIQMEQAEIVHVHNAHTLLPTFAALSKKRKQKMLLQPHYHKYGQTRIRNLLLRIHKYTLNTAVFPRASFIIVNSPHERKILLEDFPNCKDIALIPEGLSLKELRSIKRKPEKPTRILYVGALRKYKNVEKLLQAFAYLTKNKERQLKLVVVGDGPERERLVNFARELGVTNRVEWKHNLPRSQLLEEYAGAGVFVSLSQLESFSIVVHEAVSIGVPTVVPNFGATADLVEKGVAEGVDSLNPKAIAEAIAKAEGKPILRTSEVSKTFLDWEEYSERILELYRRACEG